MLGADRSSLCHDVWLTSGLKVDRYEVRTGLRDNNVVAVHHDSQVTIRHVRDYAAKMAVERKMLDR
jgi:hypothetical protein